MHDQSVIVGSIADTNSLTRSDDIILDQCSTEFFASASETTSVTAVQSQTESSHVMQLGLIIYQWDRIFSTFEDIEAKENKLMNQNVAARELKVYSSDPQYSVSF